jgi:hypothetical protein
MKRTSAILILIFALSAHLSFAQSSSQKIVLFGVQPRVNLNFLTGAYSISGASTPLTTVRASAHTCQFANGNIVSVGNNVPCVTDQGVLSEEARSNRTFFNTAIASPNWTVTAQTLTGGQSDPAGGTSASLVTDDTSSNLHRTTSTDSTSVTSGSIYTMSAFVKQGGGSPQTFVQLTGGSAAFGAAQYANFNIQTCAATGQSGGAQYAIGFSNGWCEIVFSLPGTATTSTGSFLIYGNPSDTAARGPTYTGTSKTYLIFAPQFETDLNATTAAQGFATSSIFTPTGAVQSRAADVITVGLPSCKAPSLSVKGATEAPAAYPVGQVAAEVDDGTANNYVQNSRVSATGAVNAVATVAGVSATATPTGTWAQSASGKLNSFFSSGKISGVFNNGTIATASQSGAISPTVLRVGRGVAGANFNGYISQESLACGGQSLLAN